MNPFTWYRNARSRAVWRHAHTHWHPILSEFRWYAVRMGVDEWNEFVHAHYTYESRTMYHIIKDRAWWRDFRSRR